MTFEPVSLELSELVRHITPEKFVRWARRTSVEYTGMVDGRVMRLRDAPIPPEKMTDNILWASLTRRLGTTAVGLAYGNHARLILEMGPSETSLYDPAAGMVGMRTADIPEGRLMPSNNLMPVMLRGMLREYLLKEYKLNLDGLGRLQSGGLDCGPYALYAALIANAQTPRYAGMVDMEEVKRIAMEPEIGLKEILERLEALRRPGSGVRKAI